MRAMTQSESAQSRAGSNELEDSGMSTKCHSAVCDVPS